MRSNTWKIYFFWIFATECLGVISGLISRDGIQAYSESVVLPPFSPPAILFPIVWTILYALMGIGAARIYLSPPGTIQSRGLNLYIVQLVVNFFWSPIFFNTQAYGFSFLWLILLWILTLWMILAFYKADPIAAYIQIPYLIWLTFAAYLSHWVWQLNQ